MYLDYFHLKEFPFSQAHSLEYYYNLDSHEEALNVLLIGLRVHDGIIKVTGEAGTGKSLLCRMLLNKLDKGYCPIYLPNPYLSNNELMQTIGDELQITTATLENKNKLTKAIYDKCRAIKDEKRQTLLIFDEAQGLSTENLEFIRILNNLESAKGKVVQIILVGGLELDKKLENKGLRHLTQRISFSCRLSPIKHADLEGYILYRIGQASKSDKKYPIAITPQAIKLLYKSTRGIPRLVNLICHKALMLAYSRGEPTIDADAVSKAVKDSESVEQTSRWQQFIRYFRNWAQSS